MPIRTHDTTVTAVADALTPSAGISVLSGLPTQTYDTDTHEFNPSRAVVPLIILPKVSVIDPAGKMTGDVTLTNVEYFIGAPKADLSNKIITVDGYAIGDGTVSGWPKFALKVTKDILPNSPVEIYSRAHFTDVRLGTDVTCDNSITLYSNTHQSELFTLSRAWDVAQDMEVNLLNIVPQADGTWPYRFQTQLYRNNEEVPDANAAYWWQVWDEGTGKWRDFDDDEKQLLVLSSSTTENTLTIDMRFIRTLTVRCRAAYYTGSTKPTAPADDTLMQVMSVKVAFAADVEAALLQPGGGKMDDDFTTPVTCFCEIKTRKEVITDAEKLKRFQFRLYGQAKGSTKSVLINQGGQQVTFVPKDKGFTGRFSMHFDVGTYDIHKIVTSDGKMVTSDGKAVIVPTYIYNEK